MKRIKYVRCVPRISVGGYMVDLDAEGYLVQAHTQQWEPLPDLPETVIAAAQAMPDRFTITPEAPASAAEDAPQTAPEAPSPRSRTRRPHGD